MSEYDNPRRPIKVAHLVFGSFFLGVVLLWALTESDTITWQGTSYLVPVTLLIAGGIGLAASILGSTSERRRRRQATSYEAAPMGTGTYDLPTPSDAEHTTELDTDHPDDTKEIR